jgi:hypothetical protein
MRRLLSFAAVLLVVIGVYVAVSLTSKDEGFVVNPLNPTNNPALRGNVTLPAPPATGPQPTQLPVSEALETRDVTGVLPSELPGPLPTAPYQAIARNAPYPYQEPGLIKTTRARILEVLERLKGFLAFQAQEIEERSDPSIQLPLMTARSDFKRLEAEANVLQRNPGIQPDLTDLQMNEIEANLAYLQRETEMIGVNRPFQSPAHDIDLEGFADMGGDGVRNPATHGGAHDPATLEELQSFSARVQGEILRLSASGTTDPVVNARIANLTRMKNDVDTVAQQLQSGALLPVEVPIQKVDIDKALPVLGDPSQPLPQLLQAVNLPAGLANMLPAGVSNDPDARREIRNLLEKYSQSFLDGASAAVSFTVNYVSPRQEKIAGALGETAKALAASNKPSPQPQPTSSVATTGFPSSFDLDQVASDPSLTAIAAPARVTDIHAADPRAEGRTPLVGDNKGPSHYNWRERALTIVGQIRKRGMDPKDFGATVEPLGSPVSPSFSWKGYTKMICTRLKTADAFKMDEMCGCPPADWVGWNAA